MTHTQSKRYAFGYSRRLHGRRAFKAVFETRCRGYAGPITVYIRLNDKGHPRLGLSISRKVGHAVKRNRLKRLVREAFRLGQHDWPAGNYDIVVVARPHAVATLAEYQRLMAKAYQQAYHNWLHRASKRRRR